MSDPCILILIFKSVSRPFHNEFGSLRAAHILVIVELGVKSTDGEWRWHNARRMLASLFQGQVLPLLPTLGERKMPRKCYRKMPRK